MTPRSSARFLVLLAILCQGLVPDHVHSQTGPPGFLIENAFPGATFTLPVQIVFLPDGRKFVVEKEGQIWTITAGGAKLSTPFIDLRAKVLSNDDRGLLGVAIDSDFVTNRWVYMLYTVDPDSDNADTNIVAFGRLERYRASLADPNRADLTTRQILIGGGWADGFPEPPRDRHHMVGTLRFAPDQTLLIGSGDAANASYMDPGGTDPSTGFGPGRIDRAQDIGAFRAQTLNSMDGKILRVDKETGAGLPSNPYWNGNPTSSRSRVWLYGLRNPFRFSIRPGTGSTNPSLGQPGVLYIGDVGWNTTEELHIARQGGLNFGWPCFEGPYNQSAYQAVTQTAWPNPNVICSAPLSSENPAPKTPPVLWWDHSNGANSNPVGLVGNCAIGGVFYTGTSYPPSFQNLYFLADFGRGWIKAIQVDANDNVVNTNNFIDNAGGIVDVESDPVSGDLYYIDIYSSTIQHVRYVTGNRPPIVSASVNPTSGYAPLSVTVTASGSTDPDGDPLSFLWAFGDGSTSTKADTIHTYTTLGTFTPNVTVSDGHGGNSVATYQVVVGQVPPPGNIFLPTTGTFFNQNQSVPLEATSVDTALAPATYRWDVDLAHNTHFHPSSAVLFGRTASFIATTPNDGEQYHFRIRLSVTQGALTSLDTVDVYPRLNLTPVAMSFNPSTPGPNSVFQVIMRIRSIGEVGSSISIYQVMEGTSVLTTGTLNPILNGDSLEIAATIGPLALGQHTIRFVVDPANNLFETNESDNEISGVVTVAGLVAAYAFDEGANTTVSDAAGHGLTGTISGATWTTLGKYGNALSFNGTSSYVDLGNPALLQITGSATWSAWVKAAANPPDDGQIIAKSDDASGWQLKTSPDTGPHTFGVALSASGGARTQRYSTTVRSLNIWYHVAGVYNAATQTLSIYVNGTLDNGTSSGTVPSSQSNSSVNVNIGRRSPGAYGGFYFNGIIDEVRIYNRALTQAEIQTDMNTPLGAPPPPPAAPALATPTNGTTGVATNPTLTWNASTGATSYRLQVSTDPAFGTTVADQSNITTTSFELSGLTPNTTYYWHVSAANTGGTSAYSTAWSFTTAAGLQPPAPPVLAAPANGATGVATNPTLTWNASTGATSYHLQVSTSAEFGTIVVDQDHITPTSYSLSALTGNATYFWRVHAENSAGTSAFSAVWDFTTGAPPPPPSPPVLATPANGATGVAANPTLTWNASAGATSYRLQVSTDPAFGTTLVDQSNITTTSYALGALVANTTYYWHVNAANTGGTSAYSAAWNFTTAALPPPAPPALATPANGATGVATNPTLTWNASTGATSYHLQVSTDPAFGTTVVDRTNITTTSSALSALTTNTTYYWHVSAANTGGTSAYSTAWNFTTVAPPPPPVLAAPANGATGVNTNPTLTWNASTGAISYRVQVSTDPAFGTTLVDQTNIPSTSSALSALSTNTTYYWHVNATNGGGTSAYSTAWNFTTAAIPAGLLAAYAFDEGANTTVSDATGHGLTGTISGATWTTLGKYGNALSFNGTSSYVDLGNPALLQITGSATWSAWVKAAANPPDDGQIIAKSDDASGWQLKTSPDTGPHTFGVALSASGGARTQRYSTTVRSLNIWYHVAGVYNAATQTLSIYVNGTLDNGTSSGTVPSSQSNSSVNVNIGRRSPGAYGGFYFNGIIDEVRIYNRALTQAEIQTDMNTPLGAPPPPPAAPALATPTNGTTGVATNPTLTWNASTGATSYRLQVSTDPAFGTTIVNQSNITTTSYAASGLATNTTYYWHVNAANTGGTSAYSTAWNFTTVVPPSPPVLATPANGTTGVATNPTLTWNASTGATSYRVQVSTDPAFGTTLVDQSNITTTSYALGALVANTTYYWHVGAANTGGTSAYSTAWSFTTVAPPPPPVLATPANGTIGVATNPTLTWNTSTGATSYRVQVSTDPAFGTTLVDQSNITTTSYAASGLATTSTYYWHVSATNTGGTSAYSTAWSFTTVAPPPPVAPTLATPANGTTGVATNPTLTWNASTGASSYRLQVSTDSTFGTTVVDQASITTTSYALSALIANTTYYWHVNASNLGGTSVYSTAWNFTTAALPLPPAPPVLATPANGATGVAANPTLTWNASIGATSYHLQVSTSPGFGTTVVDQSNITTTSYPAIGLAASTIYYWHVSAANTGGTSAYSTAWNFTTVAIPPGLVAAYAFDEGLGTGVADASGTGNLGTTANTTWTTAGRYGNALVFNGTNAWVVINDSPSLHLTLGMTLEAWAYPFLIPPANCTSPNCRWMDVVHKDSDRYYIEASSNVSGLPEAGGIFAGGKHIVFGPSILAVNTWTHLALTYDGAMIRLYVNGSMVVSAPETTPLTTSTNPLFIGGDQTMGQYFNGRIDEVRVYNVALTQAQIQADMNTPLGVAPAPPVLATPANGTTGAVTNPTLTWNTSTGAISYRVQVSTDPAFGTTLVDQSNITTTSYALSALVANTTYYWHVNAANTGGTSAYSTAWSFTTVAPPPPPVLATPANSATGVNTNPTLTWNASTGAISYRVQVSTDPAFGTTLVDQSNITTTSYALSTLVANTTYYWHVNAANTGGTSAYSTAWNFTTVAPPPPPAVPVLATPANGATGVATNPTLTWNASTGAISYRVQVSTDPAFGTTLVDQSNITTTSYALSALVANTTYYWHVNAANTGGTSAYSTAWNFTTAAIPAGLLAAYAFDEGANTTVSDATGHGLTGTISGATWTTLGKYGNALSFNGTTSYVDLGNPALLQITGSATWSAWVKAAANPPDDGQIIAKSDDASGWQLKTSPDTGPHTFGVALSASGGAHTQRYSTTVRSLNIWYHVAGVYNAATQTLSIYVNGTLDNGTSSGTVPSSQSNSSVNVNIGRRSPGTYGGFYFNGIIDEVRIYNRALTQAEIQTDMNTPLGAPPPPPAAPALATPTNGTTGVATNPTLTWNAPTGATSYRLQVSTDPAFGTTLVDQSNITTTSYALSTLATNTTYYWHVNAANTGGTSAYSTAWNFTTVAPPPPPAVPVLATPANGATGVPTNPTLTWNASTGATSYRVQVSTDPAFGTTLVDQSNITTTSYALSALVANTTYYWHVGAANTGGTSAYSAGWNFTTAALPPPAPPALATPTNGTTGVATNPTLTWNASTGATSYHLQVSTDPAFGTTLVDRTNITTTSSALTALTANTTYYWHVSAANGGGTSAYSTAWSFTTVAPPPPPVLATPANGATGVATNPTLTWNASTGAISYRVQVSTDPAFGTTVVDQTNIPSTSSALSALTANTTYYWHVNATNGGGTSAYSTAWNFTTAAIPAGLLAAYAFDEGANTTVSDATGHGLTGTISGATWTTLGKYGNALSFNGTTSYVDLGNPALLQITGSATWSAWVRAAANPPDDGQIIAKSDDVFGWQLKTSPDTGPHTFGVAVSASSGARIQRYSTTVRSLNTWYHVAGVYNAANQTLSTYVNGALDNGTSSGTVPSSQSNSSVNVNIGRRSPGTYGGFYFNGIIDEVRIYNRALTQAEIQTDMNTPLGALMMRPAFAVEAQPQDTTLTVKWTGKGVSVKKVAAESSTVDTERPVTQTTPMRRSVTFKISGSETEAVSYQWQKDGVDIPGATAQSYTLQMESSADSATVRCVIMNTSGNDTTDEVVVTRSRPSITLLDPVRGERWPANSLGTLRWSSSGVDRVNIDYKLGDWGEWAPVVEDLPASKGKYIWVVPNKAMAGGFVRIADADDARAAASINVDFVPMPTASLVEKVHQHKGMVASISGNVLSLEWLTIGPVNPKWVEIQKSKEPFGDYESIRRVDPSRNQDMVIVDMHSVDQGVNNQRRRLIEQLPGVGTWYFRIMWMDSDGARHFTENIQVYSPAVVKENPVPRQYSLEQNYPNPFNPTTSISFGLPQAAHVKLEVFSVLGERVVTLLDEERAPGFYVERFNALTLPSGVYFYRIQAGDFMAHKRMLLLK